MISKIIITIINYFLGPQQQYLEYIQNEMWEEGKKYRQQNLEKVKELTLPKMSEEKVEDFEVENKLFFRTAKTPIISSTKTNQRRNSLSQG